MRTVTGFAQQMTSSAGYNFFTEMAEGFDNAQNAHLFRFAAVQHQLVDRETGLQAGVAIKLVEHHITLGITFQINHHPHAVAV